MDPISAPARSHREAYHRSGSRAPDAIKWIILHDTEGGTAASIADYFTQPSSGGSAHLVADDAETFRCLPDSAIPWGAPPCNTNGLHIEFCGFARWSATDWSHHQAMLHRGAYQVAAWCKKYGIPAMTLSPAQLKAGVSGISTHAAVSAAWHETDHTDPGKGFPLETFLELVKGYLHPAPPPPLDPPVDHYVVTFTDEQGVEHKSWRSGAEVDAFRIAVRANHPTGDDYTYSGTWSPAGRPPE
jgi:hypothetical protein